MCRKNTVYLYLKFHAVHYDDLQQINSLQAKLQYKGFIRYVTSDISHVFSKPIKAYFRLCRHLAMISDLLFNKSFPG